MLSTIMLTFSRNYCFDMNSIILQSADNSCKLENYLNQHINWDFAFIDITLSILIFILAVVVGIALIFIIRYQRLLRINAAFKKKLKNLIQEINIGNEYYKLISENTTDVVWIFNADTKQFSYISPSVSNFRGISVDDAMKQNLKDKLTPESYKNTLKLLDKLNNTPSKEWKKPFRFEVDQYRADGSIFTSESYAMPVWNKQEKLIAIKGVSRDISKQKKTEEELEITERRFIDTLENSKQILYRIDYSNEKFEYISPYFLEITGTKLEKHEKLTINDFIELVHPEDKFMLEGRDYSESDFANESKLSFMREFRIRIADGSYHWFSDWSTLIFDSSKNFLANVGSLYDIDERITVENALRESETRFRSLAENSMDVILRFDRDFKHIYVNRAISTIFPFTADYFIGKSHRELGFPEEFCKHWENDIENVFSQSITVQDELNFESNQGAIILEYMIYPEFDEFKNVKTVLSNIRDVTEKKKTEFDLKQRKFEYKLIFKNAHDAIFIEDSEENILDANPSATKLFGYTLDELLAKKSSELVSPEMRKKSSHSLYYNPETSEDKIFETYLMCKDGHRIPVEVVLATFNIDEKRVIMSIVRDLSKHKKAEEALTRSKDKYRALFETIKDGMVQIDIKGRIINANKAMTDMLGYQIDEIKQFKYLDLIPDKWHKVINNTVMPQVENRGYSDDSEKEFIRKDGKILPALCRAWIVKDDENDSAHIWGLIKDITDTKNAELELNNAKDEAERASKIKGEFLANMSHEIRTPMNGVIGMCNLLLCTNLNEEQLDYADSIKISAETLLKIINDILDISRIEAGKVELDIKEFNIHKWLKQTNGIISLKAKEKGLEYIVNIEDGVPPILFGDPLRLRQVVINLVSNAVKFTEKGEVKITVSKIEEVDNEVIIKFSVTDTGIGIAEEKLAQIFDSFSQVDASSKRMYSGTGLGLTISKNIATLMGGEIGVESEIGKGSEFWFIAKLTKSRTKEPEMDASEFLQKLNILIVDDNSPDGFIVKDQLSLMKCKFDEATETSDALQKLEIAYLDNEMFKVVLIDSSIEDDTVKDFISKIKKSENIRNTVIILLKTFGTALHFLDSKEISVNAVLDKPVKYTDLHDILISELIQQTPETMDTSNVILPDVNVIEQFNAENNLKQTSSQVQDSERKVFKILLAEDNKINQKLALRILSKLGFDVNAVDNGKKAVEELCNSEYDLVFMDIQMPIMDGVEATKQIRNSETGTKNPNIPIVAMTAHAMKGDREKFLDQGLTDYISKPIDLKNLTEILEKYTK
ncbi:MAG: PAS domain S-box protein [Planctomycetes bacterium]|nr:PAS domain S-box protein [Planctomycetota bacterium]